MTAPVNAAATFTDLQGLAALRREAAGDTPEARRAVAQQFESLFLQMMLKQMRNANAIDGGLIDQDRMRFHQDMLDNQLAVSLSQGRGIGLADSILRQLDGNGVGTSPLEPLAPPRAAPSAAAELPFSGDDPEAFVAGIWPHAERAAQELDVPTEVIVAQAALETGWGRSVITDEHGRSSFNLFGIKAGASWDGHKVSVSTLEFVDGVPERRREPFRAYGSLAEGFADYVRLLAGNERYQRAVAARDVEGFARGLQAGGYATDPDYADKLIGIVRRGLPGRDAQALLRAADTNDTEPGARSSRAGGDQA